MKDGQPKEIRLVDYQAPGYTTQSVNLRFDIQAGCTQVTSRLSVVRLADEASSIVLDGQELELVSVQLDGRELGDNEYQVDDQSLEIFNLSGAHTIEIVTRICPEENTALEGLYRSSQMYCTQCEAEGFRKITYYQDRPDVLAKFTTTVIADGEAYPTLLSNGNLIKQENEADGRLAVTWQDPFPKPSYLFALVAGNLEMLEDHFETMSGRKVVLRIFSEPHNIQQCHYAMDVLHRCMAWDEQRFGREYDLDIFMIVAVEDFNMGAMENKGLNVFNTSCVLASPDTATDAAYQRVEAVVAHEYFHNWSGNRVTCRDWFQLSLKEGFTVFRDAEFSADMNSRAVKRIEDVTYLRAVQFAEDAGPLAHPVRPQAYFEISNFYTTTIYQKGAEVVGMYQTLLGEEAFRTGSDLYFDRHDGSAVTTDDFASAMASASGIDLTQFKLWYDQAGTPVVHVEEQFDGTDLVLTISQRCPATPNQDEKMPFHMPLLVGLLDQQGSPLQVAGLEASFENKYPTSDSDEQSREGDSAVQPRGEASLLVELKAQQGELRIAGLQHKPVVSFLREFSAPVRVEYKRPVDELAFLAVHDVDGFVRWDALQSLWLGLFQQDNSDIVPVIDLIGDIANQVLEHLHDPEQLLLGVCMLTMPDENYLLEQLDDVDVFALLDTKQLLHKQLGDRHSDKWYKLYHSCNEPKPFSVDAVGIATRSMKNLAFDYLCASTSELDEFVLQHYRLADNLTDRRAALVQACRNDRLTPATREQILTDFYTRWHDQALVLDMWFSLQAQSPLTQVSDLAKLEQHEKFDLTNPNRVRAVYAAFGMYNHRGLHAPDGSGYAYLAAAIAKIDDLNPQIAARLTTPLTRWRRYDTTRQSLMRQALQDLATREGISKDLLEIVTKSLA